MQYGVILSASGDAPDPEYVFTVLSHGQISGELSKKNASAICDACLCFDGERTPRVKVLFDTGSTISVVDRSVIGSLRVHPLPDDYGTLMSITGIENAVPIYSADLNIGTIHLSRVRLWESDIASKGAHVIIGTDILRCGQFEYSGTRYVFSFEI